MLLMEEHKSNHGLVNCDGVGNPPLSNVDQAVFGQHSAESMLHHGSQLRSCAFDPAAFIGSFDYRLHRSARCCMRM